MRWVGFAYVLLSVALVVTGQILLKQGMNLTGPIGAARLRAPAALLRSMGVYWQVWVGLALYVISAATWIIALSLVPLSVAYPFLGLAYVFIAGIAVRTLGEWLTPAQWIGILLVVTGVLIVALTAG